MLLSFVRDGRRKTCFRSCRSSATGEQQLKTHFCFVGDNGRRALLPARIVLFTDGIAAVRSRREGGRSGRTLCAIRDRRRSAIPERTVRKSGGLATAGTDVTDFDFLNNNHSDAFGNGTMLSARPACRAARAGTRKRVRDGM